MHSTARDSKTGEKPAVATKTRIMSLQVRAWLFLFRLRERQRAAKMWYYGHKPTWLLKLQVHHKRRKLGR